MAYLSKEGRVLINRCIDEAGGNAVLLDNDKTDLHEAAEDFRMLMGMVHDAYAAWGVTVAVTPAAGRAAAPVAVAAVRPSSVYLAEPSLRPLRLPGASRRRSTVYPVSSARKVMRCTVPSTLTPAAAASIALGAAATAAAANSKSNHELAFSASDLVSGAERRVKTGFDREFSGAPRQDSGIQELDAFCAAARGPRDD